VSCITNPICDVIIGQIYIVQLMPMIDVPFHKVAIDLICPLSLRTGGRNRWIITLVDCATRYTKAILLSATTTDVVDEALLSIFTFIYFIYLYMVLSLSSVIGEVARLMSIHQGQYTEYHPMANRLAERFNGTLKKMMIRMYAERPRDWDRYLEPLLFA